MSVRRSLLSACAVLCLGGAVALPLAPAPALANDDGAHAEVTAGTITVSDAWARATPGAAKVGGAFLTLTNKGDADRLLSASADVSETVELHTHVMDGTVMKMRQVDAIDLPANGSVALRPGSFHVMLIGLKAPLSEGQSFPLTLTFERAGKATIEVTVKAVGAMGGADHKPGHGAMPGMTMPDPAAK
ncbi:hypothetical protein CKO10_15265 [Rhodospirillum rubrum]|uniref:copper chaperone PCu(A)C n=2 Tax=Rhodospirillum rubrum TaxID=1085 RepID=UPI001907EE80|nr:copper chaperone PCu(A)C [Rhodospirillum rubrum]MBK1665819.1 hypothetical protein [Rhodospirillum rubrum]